MTTDKQARKERPIARGVLDYFPDAIAEVAHVSFVGNQQHNPGQEMHWAKEKSSDHADCIARHLIERGTIDTDGLRHSAKTAWRALAMLQIEIDAAKNAKNPLQEYVEECEAEAAEIRVEEISINPARNADYQALRKLCCPVTVARQIVDGTTYAASGKKMPADVPYVYIAGPMRGYEKFNFPAFDAARDRYVGRGFNVISPADIDRAAQDVNAEAGTHTADQSDFAFRDFWSLYSLAKQGNPDNGIVLLPGWEKSIGASAEFFLSRWLKLDVYSASGPEYAITPLHDFALVHSLASN